MGTSKHTGGVQTWGHPNIQGLSKTYEGIQTYWECPNIKVIQTYRRVSETYRGHPNIWGHPNIQGMHPNIWGASKHRGCPNICEHPNIQGTIQTWGHPNIWRFQTYWGHSCMPSYPMQLGFATHLLDNGMFSSLLLSSLIISAIFLSCSFHV